MNPEELFRGESETIEYKASVAPKSEAYMKTVIAFANGRGGQLLFGVQDISGEALGLGRKTVFKYMDAVANAIASKCEPRIHPHIYLYEIDRKPIIIVDVPPGAETPYWIQGEGIENGTYVRVGATTRKADRYRIEELILRGQHKFFDQELTDMVVKEKDAQKFCDNLFEYMQNKDPDDVDQERQVGIGQLLSWGLLHEADNHFYASNGYLLLAGPNAKFADTGIQCAVYRGNRRGHTLVRRVYDGTFYENIDGAMQFIRTHLMDRDGNDELFPRSRIAELPQESIREIVVNAVCHRSYQTPGKIQIAIFDDKIEIISPGGLDCSLAIEDIMRGRSRARNPAIGSALRYAGMFEGWGNGIPQLLADAEEHGLPEPVIRARPGDFLVRISGAEEDEPDDAMDETEMLVPAGSIVQIPTVALMEPSSSSIGMEQQQDSYEYVPFEAFAAAEQVAVSGDVPDAASKPDESVRKAPHGEWQKDVELAEHVNSVLSDAIERTRGPKPSKQNKQLPDDAQKKRTASDKEGGKQSEAASAGNEAGQQEQKGAQQRGRQNQKRKAKPQQPGKHPQTASGALRRQNKEKQQQDDREHKNAGADTERQRNVRGAGQSQQQSGNGAAANAARQRPERAAGQGQQQTSGGHGAADADRQQPEREAGKAAQNGASQQNGNGSSSRRSRRARRARKRAQERAAELEAALDAADAEEQELLQTPEPAQPKTPKPAGNGLTEAQVRVLELLRKDPSMTQNRLHEATSFTLSSVRRILVELEKKNLVKREGGRRYGQWVVQE